jgi:pyruvate dehydrogenase (quinone)
MAINNVADLLVATMEQAGIKRIFGIVGDRLNGLTEALRSRGTKDEAAPALECNHCEVRAPEQIGPSALRASDAWSQRHDFVYIRYAP